MDLKNLLTDNDRHRLKNLALYLKKQEDDTKVYKDTLANLWRITKKVHEKTILKIQELEQTAKEIQSILGEIPQGQ